MRSLITRVRRHVAVLAVGALALAGVAAVPSVALAAEGNIDPTQQGTLIIHKYENPGTTAGNGTDITASIATKPISGVVFSYAKVQNVDLNTNAGWATAQKLTVDTAGTVSDGATSYTTDTATNMSATDGTGTSTAAKLPLGVYLVQEVSAPANVTSKSAPFLVTLPYPNATAGWLYTVNVYPKNTVLTKEDTPVKVVDDPTSIHFPGDPISWTITQKIPALATGEVLKSFAVTDTLPAGVNTVTNSDVTVTLTDAAAGAVTATPTVNIDSAANKVTVTYPDLSVLKSGYTVTVKIKSTVKDVAAAITNQSHTDINGVNFDSTTAPGADPTPATVVFAALTLQKVNKENKALDGAVFTIQPALADKTGPNTAENSVQVTTKSDGALVGAVVQNLVAGDYWITETTAPVGYEIDPAWKTGKLVTVSASGTTQSITNLKANDVGAGMLPSLPLTGAQGMVILTLLGLAIVALAIGIGFVALRKNAKR
ncbi:MAG: SpaH/EbpB family LPXTG-anchored major pilin [Arcanobacterium sp.]|nr:SpaH/EbpB family LPXTG-anchored major pilin [Arcanobacterium sp.]MDY5589636.1 SpaH/EbpB family LPXTG-anchored major pilin [Arcanobacterium sp.]